jgi:hypothetical protein
MQDIREENKYAAKTQCITSDALDDIAKDIISKYEHGITIDNNSEIRKIKAHVRVVYGKDKIITRRELTDTFVRIKQYTL